MRGDSASRTPIINIIPTARDPQGQAEQSLAAFRALAPPLAHGDKPQPNQSASTGRSSSAKWSVVSIPSE
jgi:hypothetical protein